MNAPALWFANIRNAAGGDGLRPVRSWGASSRFLNLRMVPCTARLVRPEGSSAMGRAWETLAMTSITATTGTQGYPLSSSASNARTGATQAASSGTATGASQGSAAGTSQGGSDTSELEAALEEAKAEEARAQQQLAADQQAQASASRIAEDQAALTQAQQAVTQAQTKLTAAASQVNILA